LFLPLEDPATGFEHGKLLFELRGYKLRGLWTLVRTKRNAKEWLLIKKPPGWPRANGYPEVAEPVMAVMAAVRAMPDIGTTATTGRGGTTAAGTTIASRAASATKAPSELPSPPPIPGITEES